MEADSLPNENENPDQDAISKTQSQHRNSEETTEDFDEEEHPISGSFIRLFEHPPVEVTTLNKVICGTAFSVLFVTVGGYLGLMAWYYYHYPHVIENPHFVVPFYIIYCALASDLLVCPIGILSSVFKTGPKAMIYSCCWLLISSLFHVCAMACLNMNVVFKTDKANSSFETSTAQNSETGTTLKPAEDIECATANLDIVACRIASDVTIILWCSLLLIVVKICVIALCRINFPQVFNWLLNKQVLLEEDVVENAVQSLTHIGTIGAAYFAPLDIERLAARGSIYGTEVEVSPSKTLYVQKKSVAHQDHQKPHNHPRGKSLRATLITTNIT